MKTPIMSSTKHRLSQAGILITLGIIFGDIGTSPLYVIKAIAGEREISKALIYGGVSCVFWTLTLVTTIKYVVLALNADNNGEGGIFALFARLRKYKSPWIIYPAMIGCATLISDGFITPPISISSAIEGLTILNPDIPTIPIVLVILVGLFIIQQFGTGKIGKAFGPVMIIWFSMMAVLGAIEISQHTEILSAINPAYAYRLIAEYPQGIWLLGAVFLCTTGAEALYSDLGHCGKANIRVSWSFVKVALLLSYFGQSAYVMGFEGQVLSGNSPFYALMPEWFLPAGIGIATVATIIASQALISGTFTMVNEAMKLRLWPRLRVEYPSQLKGQIYIPAINWLLLSGCIAVVLIFRESANMEAAYGLAITIDMLMTTTLLSYLIYTRFRSIWPVLAFAVVFYLIEGTFFVSNASKFLHGGWFAFMIAAALFIIMWSLYQSMKIRRAKVEYVSSGHYLPMLEAVLKDNSIPVASSNLVYPVMTGRKDLLDLNTFQSLFYSTPKRADIYWFLHVDVTDEPYGVDYDIETLVPKKAFYIKLKIGFKEPHQVNKLFMEVVQQLVDDKLVSDENIHPSLEAFDVPPDFKYIVTSTRLTADAVLNPLQRFFINVYRLVKKVSVSIAEEFGLEKANVEVETIAISKGLEPKVLKKKSRNKE